MVARTKAPGRCPDDEREDDGSFEQENERLAHLLGAWEPERQALSASKDAAAPVSPRAGYCPVMYRTAPVPRPSAAHAPPVSTPEPDGDENELEAENEVLQERLATARAEKEALQAQVEALGRASRAAPPALSTAPVREGQELSVLRSASCGLTPTPGAGGTVRVGRYE